MRRVLFIALAVIVIAAPMAVSAQGPGEGGVIIEGSTRTSANIPSFLPIRCSGVDCANPGGLLFPGLVGLSPQTQNFEKGVANTLAADWEISEDGRTFFFTLRDDMLWSDGVPVTAIDIYFSWVALRQGEAIGASSSYAPYVRDIENLEIDVENNTLAITLTSANCMAFSRLGLPATPAHAYGFELGMEDTFDWPSMIDHPMDLNPTVTSGPFKFNRLEPGTAIYLAADQNYADAIEGYVSPEGFVFLDTPDENVLIERFLTDRSGEPNYIREPHILAPLVQAGEDGTAQVLNAPGRTWHYMAINLADPNNPRNGLDEGGNPVDQGHHPIFGDVLVRQALQHAINIDEIVEGPLQNNATPMVAGTIPTAFTIHPTLERRAYDLDIARALLDEAGWVAEGAPLVPGGDGLRVCRGCQYAEEGTPFYFELMNVGDVRNDVAVVIQDQFADIGVDVEVVVLDFNTMYDDNMGAQTYDAAIAGWRGALPFDPDQRSFFGAETDIYGEGYGFNFTSYYNAEFEELADAVNNVPGCDAQARIEIAWKIQEILWEEQPYLWLYAMNSIYAATPSIENFNPYPNFGTWNVDQWIVRQ